MIFRFFFFGLKKKEKRITRGQRAKLLAPPFSILAIERG